MDQKLNALKTASKVISIITKIGYTVAIVTVGICVAMLIYLAVTGGDAASFIAGGIRIVAYDAESATPAELVVISVTLLVLGGMMFATFLLTSKMFHSISQTAEPFKAEYVKTVKIVGILVAATPLVVGGVKFIASAITGADIPELFTDLPGLVVGAIIFCLSYIIDYGCALKKAA